MLDAAYQCLLRHGVHKTTVEDIARAAGMSRPAVYQYVRNKEDAFARLAARVYDAALAGARAEAAGDGTLAHRLDRILGVKLGLATRLGAESPHAGELLTASDEPRDAFLAAMTQLLTETITEAAGEAGLALAEEHAREFAALALALTRGLETDPQADRARERLRNGTALLVAGLAATVRPADAHARLEASV